MFMLRRILGELVFEVSSLYRARSALGSGESVVWLALVKPSAFTVTHRPEHEHNPNHDYSACTKRIIAFSAERVQGLVGQRLFPARLIPSRRSSLGTHKVLYSADAGAFPRESNDRSINLTTHKYGAKIINVRISTVLPLYKFMALRSRTGHRTVMTFIVKLNATIYPQIFGCSSGLIWTTEPLCCSVTQ